MGRGPGPFELALLEQVRGGHRGQVEPSVLKAAAQGPSEPGLTAASGSSALSPISQLVRPLPTPTGLRGHWRMKPLEQVGQVRPGKEDRTHPAAAPVCYLVYIMFWCQLMAQ